MNDARRFNFPRIIIKSSFDLYNLTSVQMSHGNYSRSTVNDLYRASGVLLFRYDPGQHRCPPVINLSFVQLPAAMSVIPPTSSSYGIDRRWEKGRKDSMNYFHESGFHREQAYNNFTAVTCKPIF